VFGLRTDTTPDLHGGTPISDGTSSHRGHAA
jgi:hypothetical protein